MWDNSGWLGVVMNGARAFVLLVKEYSWASLIPYLLLGRQDSS